MTDGAALPPPPSFEGAAGAVAGASAVRDVLRAVDIPEAPDGLAGVLHGSFARRVRRPILLERLERPDLDARTALVVTFAEQLPVPAAAVGEEWLDVLTTCGVLERVAPGAVRSRFVVARIGETFVVADPIGTQADIVMPPGPGTVRLVQLLPRDVAGARVLDLCAGPGSVALVAAARGATVVAVDLNPRCIAFLHANAMLNGVTLDVRRGDLFEPVAGEQFDHVTAHPPYIEQPETVDGILYMHGGESGGELPYRVLAGVPAVLAPGGEAVVEFHAAGPGDAVSDRLGELVGGRDCDAALFAVEMADADTRAINTAVLHDPDLTDTYDAAAMRYRRHLDAIGTESVAAIAYVRRWAAPRERSPWNTHVVSRDLPWSRDALERQVRAIDVVAAGDGTHLLDHTVRAAPGARLVTEMSLENGTLVALAVRVPFGAMQAAWDLEPTAAALLQRLAGGVTVRVALTSYAADTGREVDDALTHELVQFVMRNLLTGVLVLAE